MFRFLLPIACLALTACQGALGYVTPQNELRYAFLDKGDANLAGTVHALGPIGNPDRVVLGLADEGLALGSCTLESRTRSKRYEARTTLRIHEYDADLLLSWTDRRLAEALDRFEGRRPGARGTYSWFVTQRAGSYGPKYFICYQIGPRAGNDREMVFYVQPQFETEIAMLDIAIAVNQAGRITAMERFTSLRTPTTVQIAAHPAGRKVLSQITRRGSATIAVNGRPVLDGAGQTLDAIIRRNNGTRPDLTAVLR
ncbi:hypothetical protein [Jannaschia marina]|uniref:hypothetical protein n=1 Tax=Jannaschia marina TaxID=2741674 RepID=UPI0015C7C1AF|nr:hypothetical protein [Jannaschia marina]